MPLGLGLGGLASLSRWHGFLLVIMDAKVSVCRVYRRGDGSFTLHVGPRVRHVGVAFDAGVRAIKIMVVWPLAMQLFCQ